VYKVGYVVPSVNIETLPISPYFSLGILKIILELLYILIILNLLFTEIREISEAYVSQTSKKKTLFGALKKHYYSKEEYFGNLLDLTNIVLGIVLCVEWLLLVDNLRIVENNLSKLRRPEGVVEYDDTDGDVWSQYHHDIVDIEQEVQSAIENMVKKKIDSSYIKYCSLIVFDSPHHNI
jgi:hypothetical protein